MSARVARWARIAWAVATLDLRPLDRDGRPIDPPEPTRVVGCPVPAARRVTGRPVPRRGGCSGRIAR